MAKKPTAPKAAKKAPKRTPQPQVPTAAGAPPAEPKAPPAPKVRYRVHQTREDRWCATRMGRGAYSKPFATEREARAYVNKQDGVAVT